MSTLFKDLYNKEFFALLCKALDETVPHFKAADFMDEIYDADWSSRELKQRMRHISICLKNHLSNDFKESTIQLLSLISYCQKNGITDKALEFMFIPDFIEQYGLEEYESSIHAIEQVTQFTSCEFAVRPFIIKYEKQMMNQMLKWADHPQHDVRRLASEGCRPRLPWAMALPSLKKNPASIFPILEKLKSDSSEYVRRSVANNLNDISKDNPDMVIRTATNWQGVSKDIDWVIKHACRSLLKQGNIEVMQLFGFGAIDQIGIANFLIKTRKVKIGDHLDFTFTLHNRSDKNEKIRLEYGIYYQKMNGTLSKKVFKISERIYEQKSETEINRKHSFRLITTRKYYQGLHKLSLIINGIELDVEEFELTK
ncbi:DNA alkylation repair protein [Marinifilum caeruleilacunae]|uniref:DNA alkylation repair protein n=1 Tax=Marinifilum caeruleilacunae TaxID=2499076 RepID=A0ABX1WQI0_9BACT|nr:DNA alkylation repair protein [Marinifilum caeruleilacunae]NOU58346.1 DNA alkylation repair protein [Marinifilum caeruleilacunae]